MRRPARLGGGRRAARFGLACVTLAAATAGAQLVPPYAPPLPSTPGAPGVPGVPAVSGATSSALPATAATAAQTTPSWWTASVGLRETWTNNVNLNPSNAASSAFVTEITPVIGVNYLGPRASLVGNFQLPLVLYLPSGVAADRFYPTVNLLGDLTLVNNFLFLEGLVDVSQQYFSPFGAQPVGVVNPTNNRYQSIVYRISPFIKSSTSGGTSYELHNDNVWTNLSGAPISTSNAYYTSFWGDASNTTTTLGYRASFNYTDTHFNNQQRPTITQLYRATGIYTATSALQLNASTGYEVNQFALTNSQDVIYGVGFVWHPSQLTNVLGDWEHRYFGSSYSFSYDHVTQMSESRIAVSRNVTTYPQQIATLPGGVNVSAFLNALFLPVVADPAQRQQIVNQIIANRGLPSTLAGPVNLYANQTLLQEAATGTVGLLGARNTVVLTAYYVKNQPINANGTPLPPVLSFGNDNTQTGGTLVWTHQLMPSVNLVGSVEGLQTLSNGAPTGRTRQGAVRVGVSTALTPNTGVYAGARYQSLQSNVQQDYTEAAAFVGLTYTFR
jgi:uncharacterized protein (PEP-CTERM system associated)